MASKEFAGKRFDRVFLDEPVRKVLYEKNITLSNYSEHEKELREIFPCEKDYHDFITAYFTSKNILSYQEFLKEPFRFDLYPHPRYILQEPHIHDFYEMKYMMRGNGTVHIGKELLFLKESDLCLIAPYVAHSSEIYSDEATMINLVIPVEHLQDLFPRVMSFQNDLSAWFSPEYRIQADNCFLICETEQDYEIKQAFTSLLAFYSFIFLIHF